MNAMTALFPVFLALLFGQIYFRSRWLFATWTFAYCALPSYVLRVGSVTVYYCDVSAVAVLFYWYADPVRRRSASLSIQWYKVLIGTLFVGTLSSLIRYGAIFEPMYWVVRYALALATMPILGAYGRQPSLRSAMTRGGAIAAIWLFVTAVTQEFRLPFNPWLDHFLYDGYASERSDRARFLYYASEGPMRVFGPYSTSTQFGGAAVCVGVMLSALGWTFKRPTLRAGTDRYIMIATALAWVAALMTFSRHALLAILLFLAVTAAADLRKSRWVWGLSGGALLLAGSGYLESFLGFWGERIGKGGISTDTNLSARLQTRPYELYDRIMHEPSILYGGIGLGSEHVLTVTPYGFVSNSFLLYLFYCGLPAFLAFLGCFIFAFRRSFAQPRAVMPAVIPAGVLASAVIVAADNYAFSSPNLVFMWAVVIGLSFMPIPREAKPGAGRAAPTAGETGTGVEAPDRRTRGSPYRQSRLG